MLLGAVLYVVRGDALEAPTQQRSNAEPVSGYWVIVAFNLLLAVLLKLADV